MPTNDITAPKILSDNLFPVVGIGASAGGLEAFKKLVQAIPEKSGMAFILVQHLHPEYDSALQQILQRLTKIPVVEITDNVHVEPDHIYVIPSNKMLVATDGILKLSPRSASVRLNLPIDLFFTSLADVHQSHAIGVVLSGTGEDGTIGLRNIKDHGGLTFAQDPGTAGYTGMPQHAIAAEVIDFIMSPEMIPQRLVELQRSFTVSAPNGQLPKDITAEIFRQILLLIRVAVGVDFSYYKQTTVRRRIIRRMLLLHLENIEAYYDYLRKNKPELDILFQDLLIPVTSFFRDTSSFDTLCETVFPQILKNKSLNNPLRIWVAGCSTGQEAYSMAICLHEYLSDHISEVKIQIFATDVSEKSIKKARVGVYSKKEIDGISESRLDQFFNKTDGLYHVKKPVRDLCVFAVHNFLKDPPFANLDMVSCRNVLIYFEPFLQKKAFNMFHYALNDKGILLLGKSETPGNAPELFLPFAPGKKDKLFTRKPISTKLRNIISERKELTSSPKNNGLPGKTVKTDDFQKSADEILLLKHIPASVVVNEQWDIVQFRGNITEYLIPSQGKANLNILKMAREGLAFEIRNSLHKVKASGKSFIKEGIPINDGKWVNLEVTLLNTIDPHYLVIFKDYVLPIKKGRSKGSGTNNDEKDILIQHLESELAQAREDMHGIAEDQEAANEELQSSNEELLSGSEELQSLNEELETSKEELQSTNEELITVNQELYDSNEELGQSRRFAEATIAMLHEPLLVIDKNFIVKSANAAFYKTFQMTEEDTLDKILFDMEDKGWEIPGLRKELVKIKKGKAKSIETEIIFTFPFVGEKVICFNIQPLNRENGEQLILLALDDITLAKKAERLLEDKADVLLKEHEGLSHLLMDSPALFAIMKGPDFVFEFANTLYHTYTGNRKLIGRKMADAIPELKEQGFVEILADVYKTTHPFVGQELPLVLENIKGKKRSSFVNLHCQALKDTDGQTEGILVFAYDVTEQVKARRRLEANAEMIQQLFMHAPAFVCTLMGPRLVYTLVNPSYQKLFGRREIVGKPILQALPEMEGQPIAKILHHVYETGEVYLGIDVLISLARDEGLLPEDRYFNFSYQPIFDDDKKVTGVLVFGYEVTEQVQAKNTGVKNLRQVLESITQITLTTAADGTVTFFNQYFLSYAGVTEAEALSGKIWKQVIHPEDLEEVNAKVQHSLEKGVDFYSEIRLKRKHDGVYRWHVARVSPIKDKDGNILSWAGAATDIQDQKTKEQQKDEFISIASHEMKTPLTTAKAYLQLLELSIDKTDEAGILYVTKASLAIKRLSELITELLDVSKIQNGKLDYTITSFDFNAMIDDTIEMVKHASGGKSIIKKGAVNKYVTGDKGRLQQVVINLLSNAIKYSPDSSEVFCDMSQQNGDLRFSVKDNGIGIAPHDLEKIFDRYYRVEEHSIQFQGLGIGLFISHEIVQRHKGRLWAESELGKGSTFSFIMPTGKP